MISEVYNCDCMEYMATIPNQFFDLTIADPPYGVSYARGVNSWGTWSGYDNPPTKKDLEWDNVPKAEFFNELFRISKNVIIWGGNYFTNLLPVSKCWIVWDKCNGTINKSPFADAELAWTNFSKVVRVFHLRQLGFNSETKNTDRIHPTQKPVSLYSWLIDNYLLKFDGSKLFDPMMGSQSSRIAAYKKGVDFWGCELDKDYFDKGCERFDKEIHGVQKLSDGTTVRQLSIF